MNPGTCNNCGDYGHWASACPAAITENPAAADWCGECDRRTRLVDHGTVVSRCVNCHPNRNRCLPQHRRCGGCNRTVFAWESMPCGQHEELDRPRPYIGPVASRRSAGDIVPHAHTAHDEGTDW